MSKNINSETTFVYKKDDKLEEIKFQHRKAVFETFVYDFPFFGPNL